MTQAQENPVFTEPLLPTQHDAVAPDGSLVRVLARLPSGSMAHFELGAGEVPAHNGTGPSARSGTSRRVWDGCRATRTDARLGRSILDPGSRSQSQSARRSSSAIPAASHSQRSV